VCGVSSNMLVGHRDRDESQARTPKPRGWAHRLRSSDAAVQHPVLPKPRGHAGAEMPSAKATTSRSSIFDPFSYLPHNHNFMMPRGNQNIKKKSGLAPYTVCPDVTESEAKQGSESVSPGSFSYLEARVCFVRGIC